MKASVQYQAELEQNFRAAYLISQFIQETISEEDEEELDRWMQQSELNMQIFEDLTDESMVRDFLTWYAERDTERKLEEVKRRLQFTKPGKVIPIWRYAAAACAVLLLGAGIYYFGLRGNESTVTSTGTETADILPGKASATLTLADGKKIDLTNLRDTIISNEVRIVNGTVVYTSTVSAPEMHEISIPRKGFYELVLPDGSKAWINSSSSVRYPSRFNGNERRVTVTGETYFEVAKDAAHPFIVSVNGVDITALGTAFNVNAYPNEDGLRITLTEGKINVNAAQRNEQLLPGQQIIIRPGEWEIRTIDISPVVAWTKNQFKLKNTSIEEVMRMAERWYDARIVYKEKVTDHFTGTIDRNVPISQLLKLLEATGQVHFQIEGETIIVTQ
jgi:ferric-dicitrate binding protein FerR (iron transport regulator)